MTLTAGGTSATVSTPAPAALRSATTDQFRVVIGAEIIVVQASPTGASPWTILQRSAEGSTAAQHAAGTSIYHYPTAGALDGRYVQKGLGLSDLPDIPAARTNLGLGTSATQPATAFDPAGSASAEATARGIADALLVPLAQKGAVGGVGSLDGAGKQPAAELPTSVVQDTATTPRDIDSTGVAAGNALFFDAPSGKYKPGTVTSGGVSITSPDATITVGGSTSAPTLVVGPKVVQGAMIPPAVVDSTISPTALTGAGPYIATIGKPSCSVGNQLFIQVVTSAVPTTPAGWTLLDSVITGDADSYVYTRTVDGTEGTSFTISLATNTQTVVTCVSVSGQTTGTVASHVSTVGNASATTLTGVITTPSIDCLVLGFQGSADISSVTAAPPAGWTELQDGNAQFGFRQASVSWKAVPAAGSISAPFTIAPAASLAVILVAIPSANYQGPLFTKTDVLGTGLAAADLNAAGIGTDGKLLPAQTPPASFGTTWEPLYEPGVGGWITCLSPSPHDRNRWLVGGDMLGAALSTDGGDSWQAVQGFSSWEIQDFTWDPTNPMRVWAATMSGPALSIDAGRNFTMMRAGMLTAGLYPCPTQKVLIDPANNQHLFAFLGHRGLAGTAASNQGQVWESVNGGTSWTLNATLNATNVPIKSAAYSPDGSTIMCAVYVYGVTIYTSTDNGVTWVGQSTTAALATLAANWIEPHPTIANKWFAAFNQGQTNQGGGVMVSTDNGVTWANAGNAAVNSNDSGWRCVRCAPDGLHIWAATLNTTIIKSSDGGATWTAVVPVLSYGVASGGYSFAHVAGISPLDSNFIMWGTASEIIRSTDGGLTFDSASSRIVNGRKRGRGFGGFLGIRTVFSKYVEGTTFLCAMDAGNLMVSTDDESWTMPTYGFYGFGGGYDVTVPDTPGGKVVWVYLGQSAFFNGLGLSTDGGATFVVHNGAGYGLPVNFGTTKWFNAIRAISKDGLTVLATIDGQIYKSTGGNTGWTLIAGTNFGFHDLLVDRSTLSVTGSTTTVYASCSNGLYKSTNGGATWANQPGGGTTCSNSIYMNFDPNDYTKLYFCAWQPSSAAANQGLWLFKTDTGVWTRLLNDYTIRMAAVDPFNSQRIVACSDDNPYHAVSLATGIWLSNDGGATWSTINTGLRMLRIWSIAWDPYRPGRLVCGSNGGGYFVAHLPSGAGALDARSTRMATEALPLKPGIGGGLASLNQFGHLRASQMPDSLQSQDFTGNLQVQVNHAGKVMQQTGGGAVNVTFPLSPSGNIPLGAVGEFYQQGAGQITFVPASGVTFEGPGTQTRAQGSTVGWRQRAANIFVLSGDLA